MAFSNPSQSQPLAALASIAMRIAGSIIILSALLDILIVPIPYQLGERSWWLAFVTQLADRGLVPLVGLALLFAGYWVESAGLGKRCDRPQWQTLRFWIAIFASVMGLVYLIVFPLHLNNVRLNNIDLQERLTQEAQQAETQAQQQLSVEVQRRRAQIGQLLTATDEQLNQAVQSNLITAEEVDLVRGFRENPDTLDPFLQEQAETQLAQTKTQILEQQDQAAATARNESLKSGLRVGLNSLLFAIAYITIGWLGIRLLSQVL
jgi:hypothetical protein